MILTEDPTASLLRLNRSLNRGASRPSARARSVSSVTAGGGAGGAGSPTFSRAARPSSLAQDLVADYSPSRKGHARDPLVPRWVEVWSPNLGRLGPGASGSRVSRRPSRYRRCFSRRRSFRWSRRFSGSLRSDRGRESAGGGRHGREARSPATPELLERNTSSQGWGSPADDPGAKAPCRSIHPRDSRSPWSHSGSGL
jgi:hypothetical protein